ncbi:MAG: zinc metalloprotease HtpX, partial [Phormidesmis sp.]
MTTSAINLEKAFKAAIAAYQKGDYRQALSLLTQLTKAGSRTYWLKASMGIVQVYIAQKQWAEAEELCHKISKKTSIPALQKWGRETLARIEDHKAKSDRGSDAISGIENKSGFQPIETNSQITYEQTSKPQISIFHYAYLNDEIEEMDAEAGPGTESTSASESTSATESSARDEGRLWIYAGRLKQGRSLGRVKRGQLRMAQIGSAIALYFLLRFLIHQTVAAISGCLSFFDGLLPFWVRRLPNFLQDVTWILLVCLLAIAIMSPWLWDLYLHFYADRQKLSVSQLRIHSPESASLINRYCHHRRWNLPTLWKLPTDVPLIFSYGWLPRNARLVVSEGLLCGLKEDEIAALFAYELSHWKTWYWPLLSTHGLMLQVFHQIYWQLALWGNRQRQPLKGLAGTIANLSYTLFWLVRLPGLWVARVRTYYGDRAATEITGNPNGLIRGLTKLSFGLAASVERQGYTPSWVESLATLMPVCADLSRQKLYGHLPLIELFAWDSQNPLRNWMSFLDSQPPLGDRLCAIATCAKRWKLTPEIPFVAPNRRQSGLSKHEWKRLFSQGTPYLGLGLGAAVGVALWGVGA